MALQPQTSLPYDSSSQVPPSSGTSISGQEVVAPLLHSKPTTPLFYPSSPGSSNNFDAAREEKKLIRELEETRRVMLEMEDRHSKEIQKLLTQLELSEVARIRDAAYNPNGLEEHRKFFERYGHVDIEALFATQRARDDEVSNLIDQVSSLQQDVEFLHSERAEADRMNRDLNSQLMNVRHALEYAWMMSKFRGTEGSSLS